MSDELAERRNRKAHNQMLIDRQVGMPAQKATPESEADPTNPNHQRVEEAMTAAPQDVVERRAPSSEEVLALLHKSVDEYRAKGDVMNAALTLGVARHIERIGAANKMLVDALEEVQKFISDEIKIYQDSAPKRQRWLNSKAICAIERVDAFIDALKEKPQ